MYILKYFDGDEIVLSKGIDKSYAIKMAEKNQTIYQVIRNNRDKEIVWERENPEE